MNRLHEYDTVTLNIPFAACHARTIDVFDARVLAIVGPTAALQPVRDVRSLGLPDRADDVLLCFRHERALVGLKGTLSPRPDTGDLRFTVEDGVQLHRRRATRIKVSLPMRLRRVDTPTEHDATTVDLSADGILAETGLQAAVGDLLNITIWLERPGDELQFRARVVRQGGGLIAMQLAPKERLARSRLGGFVVEHNRERLRARTLAAKELVF